MNYLKLAKCSPEIKIVLATLIVIILLPIISVVVFASSGLELISKSLVSVNAVSHMVDVYDANGKLVTQLQTSTVWPVHGIIFCEFGVPHMPWEPYHTGIDIADPRSIVGAPVTTFMPGRVIKVLDTSTGYGKHVIIDHGNGITSIYGHMSQLNAIVGQEVNPGDVIGLEGSTGWSTGPHVHFEVRVSGIPVNPHMFMVGEPDPKM